MRFDESALRARNRHDVRGLNALLKKIGLGEEEAVLLRSYESFMRKCDDFADGLYAKFLNAEGVQYWKILKWLNYSFFSEQELKIF